jgi:two-component system response regulator AtoC
VIAEEVQVAEGTVTTNLLNLLIVEDERSVRECCREVARSLGFAVQVAECRDEVYRAVDSSHPDVILLDLRLPGCSGLDVLRELKRRSPEAVVIVMTGFATVQSAVQAMKLGAYDYITKPFNFEELRLELDRVTAHLKLTAENRVLREQLKSKQGFGQLIGH